MPGLVFLDFDGVICDSILETLVSSWRGYHRVGGQEEPTSMPVSLLKDFSALRPYVRAGEDFILIHELIDSQTAVRSQQHFDAELGRRGADTMARYREAFYEARRNLLASHRGYWLKLNRLYPHVRSCLAGWASSSRLYILSTKRGKYIQEILGSEHIHMERRRVLSCGAREKKATILATLDSRGFQRALFVDDQIDHLASDWAPDPRITGCLASWGYVQRQWLQDPRGVEVLRPEQFAGRVGSWLVG